MFERTGKRVARPEGIEPPTLCLEGRCSIRLSYGRSVYSVPKAAMDMNKTMQTWTYNPRRRGT